MQELCAPSEALSLERLEILSNWAESLRAACYTVSRASDAGLTTLAITGRLKGGPGEARLLRALSAELAQEYGVQESLRLEGDSFTARLSQPSPVPVETQRSL